MAALDQRDEELLNALEKGLPITSTPFAIIGQMTDMSEKEVIKRIFRYIESGVVRGLQVSLDARAVGCEVALVVARFEPPSIERGARSISSHPGVSQNYRRNHRFNLWFTLCLPPTSSLGMERTVDALRQLSEAEEMLLLPGRRQFVRGEENSGPENEYVPNPEEISFIRALDEEIPLQPRPFDVLARRHGLERDAFLAFVQRMNDEGRLTSTGPVIVRRPGRFSTAAMGIWAVEDRVEETARILSDHPSIASATIRDPREGWPWNVFTIVQGSSVDECESAMLELSNRTGTRQYETLFPVEDFRSGSAHLFPADLPKWERKAANPQRSAVS